MSANEDKFIAGIKAIVKTDIDYDLTYDSGEFAKLTILNNHVFRFYMSPSGEFYEYPAPRNPEDLAKINIKRVSDYSNKPFKNSYIHEDEKHCIVNTHEIKIIFDKIKGTFIVHDKRTDKSVLMEIQLGYNNKTTKQILHQHDDEYYFGGGMQNGRFTHKGEVIHIVNSNSWTDGGVTSPSPFFWSTYGYGVLRNTWSQGYYDFGNKYPNRIESIHSENYFDAFYFISSQPHEILKDYYELTGQPILMPEFSLYEAHLNTFNRDYWVEVTDDTPNAILFEDGKYYKKYQPKDMNDKTGILESLNGEKNNYQFSARAMIDRYKNYDMPLGWFIPNDGYGSGYGQTDTFEGDLDNLKKFIEYAHKHNVQVGLWTESCLEPKDPDNPKKGERDLLREVGIGSVALKCDVAWIGDGYSFGLNAVEHASSLFRKKAHSRVRPFIIMVDGWAGTQRYSGIWSGDQTGGKWEYIRFHIPTYIGAGLSGIPIVGSDMDGIYGGGVKEINIRDYQWKTFTPLQLGMDGWGNKQKTPFSFDQEAQNINRAYLKLKATFLPYNYTLAYKSINGLPMVRAMFLEYPNEIPALTKDSQYQYMWGPSILVAPVYDKVLSVKGTEVRNDIYLPDQDQIWIDIIDGKKYSGGKIYNNIEAPLWKLPVFVKDGAIIPMVNDNNNPYEVERDCRIFLIYPNGKTAFKMYEDDGISSKYLENQFARTKINVNGPVSNTCGDLTITIHYTTGHYKTMFKERITILRIMASKEPKAVKIAANGEHVKVTKANTKEEFELNENVYYYDQKFLINPYFENITDNTDIYQNFLLIKIGKVNVTKTVLDIKIIDFCNIGDVIGTTILNSNLKPPENFTVIDDAVTSSSIPLRWKETESATSYELERDGTIFSNILDNSFTANYLKASTEHKFRVRTVNKDGVSKWSYMIVVETAEDTLKYAVKGVTATCNIPDQPREELWHLTRLDNFGVMWHTDWNMPGLANSRQGKEIILTFDLNDVYDIDKVEYTPRKDGGNGTFLRIQYKFSIDGQNWSEMSPLLEWPNNDETKIIQLNGRKLKYFQINVVDSVGGFGSGRSVIFYTNI